MNEDVVHLEGNLIELIIQTYLRFKFEGELLTEVSLRDAVNTIKRVIERYSFDRDNVPLKEFLVDLRNLTEDEGYALDCDIGADGNQIINIYEWQEELEDAE